MTRNNILIFITVCLPLMLFNACKDDSERAGSAALTDNENVIVCADTLRSITSAVAYAPPVYTTPDSLLLGECTFGDYGMLRADILTQFASPEGWVYPDMSELDSVCLYIYYRSNFGDSNAPWGIMAYALDGESLSTDSTYSSDTDVKRFCSLNDSLRLFDQDHIFAASTPDDSIYSSALSSYVKVEKIRLNEKWARRLFAIKSFSSVSSLSDSFKGIYLTSTYGSSSVVYINNICLTVHYHYTFPTTAEGTTYKTLSDYKVLYANSEVATIQRYTYTNDADKYSSQLGDKEVNYIVSPAYMYTRLKIPADKVSEMIDMGVKGRKHKYINRAELRIDVVRNTDKTEAAAPTSTMMLIDERRYEEVCVQGMLPDDSTAVFASLSSVYNTDSAAYLQYYEFDMSDMFTCLIHDTALDTLNLLLVPVDVTVSSTSSDAYISKVRVKQTVSATRIMGAGNTKKPMDIEIIYSGFTSTRIGQ